MNLLQELGVKYNTDKSKHKYQDISYLDIYNKYFFHKRESVKTFVEIGVLNGSSLKMWEEYFPNAIIHGVDINPECKQYEGGRIKIHIGDQNDTDFLNQLKQLGEIDILLDDGSHITSHQINTYDVLYGNINNGGLYVIEDLANSYEEFFNEHDVRRIWPGMSYNKPEDELKNYRRDFNEWIEDKVKNLDLRQNKNFMKAIHFYPMIIIFEN
jgi:hypothetical protein